MAIYQQRDDGEWIDVTDGHYFQCCDCGLVHYYEYRVVSGRIIERAFRDNRATAGRRRSLKAKKQGLWSEKQKDTK